MVGISSVLGHDFGLRRTFALVRLVQVGAILAGTFWRTWVWPAGGSGGIWGDVVGSFLWTLLVAVTAILVWPQLRHTIERFVKNHFEDLKGHISGHHRAVEELRDHLLGHQVSHADELRELRRRIDHVIQHHPDIPPLPETDEARDR